MLDRNLEKKSNKIQLIKKLIEYLKKEIIIFCLK